MQPSFGEIKPTRSETKKSKSRPGERKSSRSGERIICIRNIKATASKPSLKERSASIKRTTQSSLNRSREAFYKPEPLRTIDNALNVSQTKLPNADMPSSVKQSARLEQTDFNDTQNALRFKDQTIAMLKEKLTQLQEENRSLKERLNEKKESLTRT